MKLNIKALAATALVSLTFASCNSDFDEDGGKITYADKMELCSWSRANTSSNDASYVVNLYLNEAGDTLADISIFNPVTELSNVLNEGKVKYDAKTGVANISYEESMYGTPVRVSLVTSNDKQSQIVNIYQVSSAGKLSEKDRFTAVKTDTISALGQWTLGNGEEVSLYNNGSAVFSQNGEVVDNGTYTFDGKNGSITKSTGEVYTLAMNANRQIQVTIAGTTYSAAHVPVVYIDDWTVEGQGTYYSWLFDAAVPQISYEYSACRGEYRIDMSWFPLLTGNSSAIPGQYVIFNWNKRTNAVAMSAESSFNTGFNFQGNGLVHGSASGQGMTYADGVFSFSMAYSIPNVGGFGAGNDTFTIEAE